MYERGPSGSVSSGSKNSDKLGAGLLGLEFSETFSNDLSLHSNHIMDNYTSIYTSALNI